MNNKTTTESATTKIGEQEIGSYIQVSFSRAPEKNHDALAQLDEAAARMHCLAELSKEIEGRRLCNE
jgi:hypothetical protein